MSPSPSPARKATPKPKLTNPPAPVGAAEPIRYEPDYTPADVAAEPLTLAYFVRRFPAQVPKKSNELRYSLRSVEANVTTLGAVHVFGGRPEWLTEAAQHHRVSQTGGKHDNTWSNWCGMADAVRAGSLPERFVIMNDDFYVVEPIESIDLAYHGTTTEWIAARRHGGADHAAGVMTYTQEVLVKLGVSVEDQLAFELHIPFPVEGAAFVEAIEALKPFIKRGVRIAKRSAVANYAAWQASAVSSPGDVKVREPGEPLPSGPFWSTSDESFLRRPYTASMREAGPRPVSMGDEIRARFAEPSRFERAIR